MTLQSCNAVVPQKKPFSNSFLLAHLLSLTKHIERATPNDTILNFESCTLNIVTNPKGMKNASQPNYFRIHQVTPSNFISFPFMSARKKRLNLSIFHNATARNPQGSARSLGPLHLSGFRCHCQMWVYLNFRVPFFVHVMSGQHLESEASPLAR